jgi:hypothetical protein
MATSLAIDIGHWGNGQLAGGVVVVNSKSMSLPYGGVKKEERRGRTAKRK